MHQRINISLPTDTVRLIDRIVKKGSRSALIDKAVRHFVQTIGRAKLRARLEKSDPVRAARDLQIAEEWFTLEDGD